MVGNDGYADGYVDRDMEEARRIRDAGRRKRSAEAKRNAAKHDAAMRDAQTHSFLRSENEDDDGYDPFSDRPASPETWEADPWTDR